MTYMIKVSLFRTVRIHLPVDIGEPTDLWAPERAEAHRPRYIERMTPEKAELARQIWHTLPDVSDANVFHNIVGITFSEPVTSKTADAVKSLFSNFFRVEYEIDNMLDVEDVTRLIQELGLEDFSQIERHITTRNDHFRMTEPFLTRTSWRLWD